MGVLVNVRNETNSVITVGFFNGPAGNVVFNDISVGGDSGGNLPDSGEYVVAAWIDKDNLVPNNVSPVWAHKLFQDGGGGGPGGLYSVVVNNGSIDID